jgi:hypothetical protein
MPYACTNQDGITDFARRSAGAPGPTRPNPRVSFLSRTGPSVTFPCPTAPLHFLAMPLCFSLKRGPDPCRDQTVPKEKKTIPFPIFFSRKHRRQKNIPRRNEPLHRQGAGDTAKSSNPLRRRRRRDKEEQEQKTLQEGGSGSLGEGEAFRSCRRGTRARRRTDSVILAE